MSRFHCRISSSEKVIKIRPHGEKGRCEKKKNNKIKQKSSACCAGTARLKKKKNLASRVAQQQRGNDESLFFYCSYTRCFVSFADTRGVPLFFLLHTVFFFCYTQCFFYWCYARYFFSSWEQEREREGKENFVTFFFVGVVDVVRPRPREEDDVCKIQILSRKKRKAGFFSPQCYRFGIVTATIKMGFFFFSFLLFPVSMCWGITSFLSSSSSSSSSPSC